MPNFDTFMENLHSYVKRTEDPSLKKYRFQESFNDFATSGKAFDDVQDAFFADQRRQASGLRHRGMNAAKAEPAS